MLTTLGFVALVVGIVLIIVGYTIEARAIRPGWACVILAVVLILLGYLLPAVATPTYHDTALASTTPL